VTLHVTANLYGKIYLYSGSFNYLLTFVNDETNIHMKERLVGQEGV
jgi:hypothetical protein